VEKDSGHAGGGGISKGIDDISLRLAFVAKVTGAKWVD